MKTTIKAVAAISVLSLTPATSLWASPRGKTSYEPSRPPAVSQGAKSSTVQGAAGTGASDPNLIKRPGPRSKL